MPKLGILVPARNCAAFLPELVARTPLRGPDDEIIIVDDESSDGTSEVAARLPRVHVIRNETKRGYGGTSKRLYEIALARGCDFAVNIHGDLGHEPENITLLADALESEKADLVIGSRLLYILKEARALGVKGLRHGEHAMPWSRLLGHLAITAVQNLCYGTTLHSFHEGMRACTRAMMEWSLRAPLPDWYDFDTHLIVAAHRAGFGIFEVPVPPHYQPDAHSSVPLIRYGLTAVGTALSNNRFRAARKAYREGIK